MPGTGLLPGQRTAHQQAADPAANPAKPSLLLAIAGRLWPDLKHPELLGLFLEQLALQPTQFFNQVFAELVTLPALRNDMLAKLRDPERSEALGLAIGRLFAAT